MVNTNQVGGDFGRQPATFDNPVEGQINCHMTDDWELTVKIFSLKRRRDNERATSSFW